MKSYLKVTNADQASAMLVYLPSENNYTTYAPVPSPTDGVWSLGDNDEWKKQNNYPVYAISANDGHLIMDQLAE